MSFFRLQAFCLILVVCFLSLPGLRAQQPDTVSSRLPDRVIALVQQACDPKSPSEFKQFKQEQISRRLDEDQTTIALLNKDVVDNASLYTDQDRQARAAKLEQLNAEVLTARTFIEGGCSSPARTASQSVPVPAATTPTTLVAGGTKIASVPAQTVSVPAATPTTTASGSERVAASATTASDVSLTVAASATPAPTAQAAKTAPTSTPDASPCIPAPPASVASSLPFVVSAATVPFNSQILLVPSTSQMLFITNSSDTTLSFAPIVPGGCHPQDFSVEANNCTTALTAKASCTFSVSFTPTEVGTRNSTLSISTQDAAHSAYVTLSGTGNDPGTAPTVFTPLVQGLKVVSGIADKKALSVDVAVYNPECDPKQLLTAADPAAPCKQIAKGYTAGIERNSGSFSVEIKDTATLAPAKLKTGDLVVVTSRMPTTPETIIPAHRVPLAVQQVSYSESLVPWGNVTPTFSTGFILSQNNGQFSQYNFFADFNIEDSFHISPDNNKRLNTFVDAQVTAIPAAACSTTSTTTPTTTAATSGNSTGSNCLTGTSLDQSFNSFISAQKAAVLQAGIYYPWQIPSAKWSYGGSTNALFLGPIVKGGLQTVTTNTQSVSTTTSSSTSASSSTSTTITSTFVPSGFYGNWSAGIRVGHFKLWDSWNVAPELLSYLDLTFGKWNSFEQCPSTPPGCKFDAATGKVTNVSAPFLMGVQARIKIPDTPLLLGFDTLTPIAAGTGRSSFQFTIGFKTDLACVFNALKSASTLNSSGSCQKTNEASQQSAAPAQSTLTITTTSLPDGTAGSPYSQTLRASGGTPPYAWTTQNGLPTGLAIDGSSGQITGTPTAAGNNNFSVTVTDSSNPKATATANLTIKIAAATAAPSVKPKATPGSGASDSVPH